MSIQTITQDGIERILMDRDDYEALVDARDAAVAMRDIAHGAPTLRDDEVDAYLAAPTPLAFWRKRAGKTQAGLAAEADITQPFLAQIETGKRDGTVAVLARLAKALGLRVDDLIAS